MKYHKIAKPIAFALAAMLAIPPVSASAITFADINQAPWPGAEVSINKAAELKLVVGETINGKNYFKPKDPVSLTQTCQLAYKLLLETGKAKADASVQEKWSTVMNTYKIQSWAHPAVSFCLEEGIISISDLSGFISGEVNRSATREQAAEILGRALEAGVPSKTANATSTIFKDNASISKDAIPYIALLNAEKIVNGDDLGKFNPKSTLNRTETAVMVTNLYNVLKGAATVVKPESLGTQSGTINDMNSLYVNFEHSNAYFLYASAGATITLNGSTSSVSELVSLFKEGSKITATLTLDSNNRITKLVATSEDAEEEKKDDEKDTEGTLTKVKYDEDDGDGYIVINKTSTYKVDDIDDVDVEIDDDEMDFEELFDLFEECEDNDEAIEVEVTLNSKGELRKIIGEVVDADDEDSDDAIKGEVSKITYDEDDAEGSVKVKSTTYEVEDTDDVSVKIDGKTKDFETLFDLYEDDEYLYVTLTLDKDDYVTKIVASTEEESEDEEEAEGEIESVTWKEDKDTGTLKVDGDTYKSSDVEDVEINIIDGTSEIEDWEALYNAFKDKKVMDVTVVIENDEIVEIEGSVKEAKGVLTDWNDDSLEIEGNFSDNEFEYEFDEDNADDIDVDIDGSNMGNISDMEDLLEFLEDYDDDDEIKVTLTLDKNGYITEVVGERE